jgi:hypothetical protein
MFTQNTEEDDDTYTQSTPRFYSNLSSTCSGFGKRALGNWFYCSILAIDLIDQLQSEVTNKTGSGLPQIVG